MPPPKDPHRVLAEHGQGLHGRRSGLWGLSQAVRTLPFRHLSGVSKQACVMLSAERCRVLLLQGWVGCLRAVETAAQELLRRPALRLQQGVWLNDSCIRHHHMWLSSRWPGLSVVKGDPGMWPAALNGAPACACAWKVESAGGRAA